MAATGAFLSKKEFLTAGFHDFRDCTQASMAKRVKIGGRKENALPRSDEMTTTTAGSLAT